MSDLATRVAEAVAEIEDKAEENRRLAHSPSISATMRQAHLHRATAFTGAARRFREVLQTEETPSD